MVTNNMMVDVILECGCTIAYVIESIVCLPATGSHVMCGKHNGANAIMKVGQPYRDLPGYNEALDKINTSGILPMFDKEE